jgi:hypothetical protein
MFLMTANSRMNQVPPSAPGLAFTKQQCRQTGELAIEPPKLNPTSITTCENIHNSLGTHDFGAELNAPGTDPEPPLVHNKIKK